MAGTVKVFSHVIDIVGARVVVTRDPLCPGCLSDGEVDTQIALLKDNLDAVAKQMKRSIREQARKPLFTDK